MSSKAIARKPIGDTKEGWVGVWYERRENSIAETDQSRGVRPGIGKRENCDVLANDNY